MDGKCKSVHLSRKCFRKCFLKQSPYCGITRLKIKSENDIYVINQYNKNSTEGMFDNLSTVVDYYIKYIIIKYSVILNNNIRAVETKVK